MSWTKVVRCAEMVVYLVCYWPLLAWADLAPPMRLSEARELLTQVQIVNDKLDEELKMIAEDYKLVVPEPESGLLGRRLREAEVQSLLGDHYRAAVILSDIAGHPDFKWDPKYSKAIYLYAESLRKAGYPNTAKVYYEQLAEKETGRGLSQVVLGLLEVSSATGDFAYIDTLMSRIKGKGDLQDSRVDYIYGKALLRGAADDSNRILRALRKFRSVPVGLSISSPSAYYAGVTLVRLKRYQEAIAEFQRALSLAKSFPQEAEMKELSLLSLGRLYQELGDPVNALSAYRSIPRDSSYFAEMLYEVAWVHVAVAGALEPSSPEQEKQYQLALDVTELLMATSPSSLFFPEARVLQGNLRIRLGAEKEAYETFQTVVDVYGKAENEFKTLLASRKDAQGFFNELVASDLNDLSRLSLLPDLFLRFALEDSGVADTVDIRRKLAKTSQELKESLELVRTLNSALSSSQRFALFPGLSSSLTQSLSVLHRNLFYRQQLLQAQRGLMVRDLSEVVRAKLEAAQFREEGFEQRILSLPLLGKDIIAHRQKLKKQYTAVEHRVFLQLTQVQSMHAQLAAARIWMARHRPEMLANERAITDRRLSEAKKELENLTSNIEHLQGEVKKFIMYAGAYSGWSQAMKLSKQLRVWEDQQEAILADSRSGLSDDHLGLITKIDAQKKILRVVEDELVRVHDKMDEVVAVRVDEIRAEVLLESTSIEELKMEHQRLSQMSDRMLGPVATKTIDRVGEKFRELVLKADVGILDVAWARKRARTGEVTKLVRELRQRSSELDAEFSGVLEDR